MTDDEILNERDIQSLKLIFDPTHAGRMRAFERLEEIDAEIKRRRQQSQPAHGRVQSQQEPTP